MSSPTFKDLLDFVLANKSNKTFLDMTTMHIISLLQKGIEEGTLLYHQDSEGKVIGMVLAERRDKEGILFVTENLSMNLATLKIFSRMANKRWPHLNLQWYKHNILKKHSTEKFYDKMSI